jgi:hypothetical protein
MPLTLQPNIDAGPGDFNAMHGELIVGRLYKRAASSSVGSEWLSALNGVPSGHQRRPLRARLQPAMKP